MEKAEKPIDNCCRWCIIKLGIICPIYYNTKNMLGQVVLIYLPKIKHYKGDKTNKVRKGYE